MRVSLSHARARAWILVTGTVLVPVVVACSGDDLLLPDDPAPVQLRAVSGDGQSAVVGTAVPHPLVVEAVDRAGRPVEGAIIVFQFVDSPDGAAIAPAASETDPEGRASVEVTLGRPAGEQPVDARLEDPDRDLSVRFLLTAIQSNNGGGGGGDDDPPPDDGGGGDDGGHHHGKGKGNGGGGGGNNGGGNDDSGDED
jgi:hypothetical protein